jgi:hypothetical protein
MINALPMKPVLMLFVLASLFSTKTNANQLYSYVEDLSVYSYMDLLHYPFHPSVYENGNRLQLVDAGEMTISFHNSDIRIKFEDGKRSSYILGSIQEVPTGIQVNVLNRYNMLDEGIIEVHLNRQKHVTRIVLDSEISGTNVFSFPERNHELASQLDQIFTNRNEVVMNGWNDLDSVTLHPYKRWTAVSDTASNWSIFQNNNEAMVHITESQVEIFANGKREFYDVKKVDQLSNSDPKASVQFVYEVKIKSSGKVDTERKSMTIYTDWKGQILWIDTELERFYLRS